QATALCGALAAGLRHQSPATARAQAPDLAVVVGGIPASESGRLPLLALLLSVPALALEAGRGAAAGAQSGREDVRRLGRCDDSGVRPAHRRGVASSAVRSSAGSKLLHLGRSHARSADGSLAALP